MSKERNIQKWFNENIFDMKKPYFLDRNQAKIILDNHYNTIVTARAGSGKTRTLIAKIAYLMTHEQILPEEIIVFAFNKKARIEVNQRLANISFQGQKIFQKEPKIATTFHAFAYHLLDEKYQNNLIDEETENQILSKIVYEFMPNTQSMSLTDFQKQVATAKQFITKAEQKFFLDYTQLSKKIQASKDQALDILFKILESYHTELNQRKMINFNQMISLAAKQLQNQHFPYRYILVDEYQDFSLLFLTLIQALRKACEHPNLLCVGDDWQAINRFAGSDVDYFINFQKYFPEDYCKLFIPSNYRSGKKIVQNANYFMSRALGDFNGCLAKNKLKSKIYYRNIQEYNLQHKNPDLPLLLENYLETVLEIIQQNRQKSIKILARNNDLNFRNWSLVNFVNLVREEAIQRQILKSEEAENLITESTIHRSKGLESDVVILLEIDAEKFPSKDKSNGLYRIFGEDEQSTFADEVRLFYVALTRSKEKLFILSKSTKIIKEKEKYNFFHYLNRDWLDEW